jgi:acetyl-CoA acetyltransferase
MADKVAIVGVGQTYHKSKRPDVTQSEMVNEAVRAALADAEMSMKDIDAVFVGNMEAFEGIYLPDLRLYEAGFQKLLRGYNRFLNCRRSLAFSYRGPL